MSKASKLRAKFGEQIREAVGGGGEATPTVVDHPSRNIKFEGVRRATGVHKIDLTKLVADKQHREDFDRENLEQLASSLNANGLIQPIVVRWDQLRKKYVIIAGERRFRAAKISGWKEIKCDVKPDDISEGEIADLQLTENLTRKDLNPIEKAKAFSDVIEKNGYTVRELSKKVGLNETTVTRHLRLLSLPVDIQGEVANFKISFSIAREAARIEGEGRQREFIQQMIAGKYSADDAQRIASGRPRRKRQRKRSNTIALVTDYGKVTVNLDSSSNPTYHHIEEMLEQALEEVRVRSKNRVTLTFK